MAEASSPETTRTSSINLVRSSHPWTQADSAAGFVLRYLVPMRRQLAAVLGSNELADEALKLLLAHLVSVGFGEHKRGRLRDFLMRGIRSAAKSSVAEKSEAERATLDLESLTLESKAWLMYWREGLLERAWRSLERQEHAHPDQPVHTVLRASTQQPTASPEELASQLASTIGLKISSADVQQVLAQARVQFAQLIADEVAETLETPTRDDVKREIAALGLGKAFSGIAV